MRRSQWYFSRRDTYGFLDKLSPMGSRWIFAFEGRGKEVPGVFFPPPLPPLVRFFFLFDRSHLLKVYLMWCKFILRDVGISNMFSILFDFIIGSWMWKYTRDVCIRVDNQNFCKFQIIFHLLYNYVTLTIFVVIINLFKILFHII